MDINRILDITDADFHYKKISDISQSSNIDLKFRLYELRKIFESIFKNIIRKERQFFDSTFSRIKYISDKFRLSGEIQTNIHNVRIFLNKVAHESSFEIREKDYENVIGVLCSILSFFSGLPVPGELQPYSEEFKADFPVKNIYKNPEILSFARATVTDISERKTDKNGNDLFILTCENDNIGTFRVFLNDLPQAGRTIGNRYSTIGRLARKYSSINIFNIKNTRDNIYSVIPQTLIVLEPDFLTDVTDIAGCFSGHESNYMLFLLSKIIASKTTRAMLQGKIVNDIFDELIFNPDSDLDGIIKESVFQSILLSLSLGFKTISEIMKNIKSYHYNNLKRAIKDIIRNDIENKAIKLEPSFLSTEYGLQGRLDALISYKGDSGKADIIELKSGSSPDYGVWENHKMQVVCYDMLLKNLYSKGRRGSSCILYSGNAVNPIRNVACIASYEKDIVMIRNQIVSAVWEIAEGNHRCLAKINNREFGDYPGYKEDEILLFNYCYNNADKLDKEYYREFISFLFRELIASKIGFEDIDSGHYEGFSQLWKADFETKRSTYNIIDQLEYLDFDDNTDEFSFRIKSSTVSNFREGDIAVLYPQQKDNSFPLDREIIRGFINSIDEKSLKLKIRNKLNITGELKKDEFWVIEHDFFESGNYTLCQSLFDFLGAKRETKDLLLGIRQPGLIDHSNFAGNRPYAFADQYLQSLKDKNMITDIQSSILKKMIKARDYFLLQGPPGTGKTSIILLNLASILTSYFSETIAVLAFTNRAVNEICNKLKENGIDFIRLGSSQSGEDYVLSNLIKGKKLKDVKEILKNTKIIVSTASTFNSRKNEILNIKQFDSVIVDESSQLLEPQLIGILIHFKRFFLIGDQNQLPAISVQEDSGCIIENQLLKSIGIEDLRSSLFERLYRINMKNGWNCCTAMLQDQYRMHESIAGLINCYYDNKLVSKLDVQVQKSNIFRDTQLNDISRILGLSRTVFIESRIEGTPKTNIEEARRTVLIIRTIHETFSKEFSRNTIGVITPWRAQANEIKKLLPEELSRLVTVDTVERFQGSERDIIVFSLALCHKSQLNLISNVTENDINRSKVDRKLNVAVSRAKQHLIILGYAPILSDNIHFSTMLDKIKKADGYIPYRDADAVFRQYYSTIKPA